MSAIAEERPIVWRRTDSGAWIWTTEADRRLREMRAAGIGWYRCAAILGGPSRGSVQDRARAIGAPTGNGTPCGQVEQMHPIPPIQEYQMPPAVCPGCGARMGRLGQGWVVTEDADVLGCWCGHRVLMRRDWRGKERRRR